MCKGPAPEDKSSTPDQHEFISPSPKPKMPGSLGSY